MSWDIHGNPLRRGHCEVHPHVAEEYPCFVCIADKRKYSIEAPKKPMSVLQVDAKVYVWSNTDELKLKRHFSHFKNGDCHTFDGGHTSWTGESTSAWDNWELAE